MGFVDLHTHSTYSDGTYTPEELVSMAVEKKLKAIALTDHDTLNGVFEAGKAAEKYGIEFIPGCEISASYKDAKVHVLGYFPNGITGEITEILEERRKNRHTRIKSICEKLRAEGLELMYEDVVENEEKESPGRANVAEALVAKGYVSSVAEAFKKYLVKGRPGFVENKRISPEYAIEIIKKNGGKAFIAHLNQIKIDTDELFTLLKDLKQCGLDGIEGYYTQYTMEENILYRSFAERLGLSLSGGSDFHGSVKPKVGLGTGFGDLRVPYEIYENIMKI